MSRIIVLEGHTRTHTRPHEHTHTYTHTLPDCCFWCDKENVWQAWALRTDVFSGLLSQEPEFRVRFSPNDAKLIISAASIFVSSVLKILFFAVQLCGTSKCVQTRTANRRNSTDLRTQVFQRKKNEWNRPEGPTRFQLRESPLLAADGLFCCFCIWADLPKQTDILKTLKSGTCF